ncbi:hypothetical protein ACIBCH_37460 [Amycolatopsis thailandensis]|uniref:hypothetical protein n=1 Tax=Amycolatopsis thailandensis TaxID=589330 RepID=UPI00379D5888
MPVGRSVNSLTIGVTTVRIAAVIIRATNDQRSPGDQQTAPLEAEQRRTGVVFGESGRVATVSAAGSST